MTPTESAASEPVHHNLAGRWRVGRKVGRTIYAQQGPEPSDDDPLIGVMDYPALAALAVECRNRSLVDHREDS